MRSSLGRGRVVPKGLKVIKAFSLIEAMISSLIVAGMTLGVLYLVNQSSGARAIDQRKADLIQSLKLIEAKMKVDFGQAVRATGSSRSEFMGISTFDVPSIGSGLSIIVEHYGQFSTPVRLTSEADNQVGLNIQVNAGDVSAEYIQEAMRRRSLFLISDAQYSNVISVDDNLAYNQTRTLTNNRLNISSAHRFMLNEHTSAAVTPSLRTLQVVLWYMKDGAIIREVRTNLPQRSNSFQVSRQVLAENITKFDFDFMFEDRRGAGKQLPTRRLVDVTAYLPSSGCTENCCSAANEAAGLCADMNDVKDIRIALSSIATDAKLKSQPPQADGFTIMNGLMKYDYEFYALPIRYGISEGSIGLSGQYVGCLLRDPESKCNPNCAGTSGPFQNHTLLPDGNYPPDWHAWGDVDSDLCKCYTANHTTTVKDWNVGMVPAWDPNGGSDQLILTCARVVPACSAPGGETWVMARYPPAYMSCWCLQPQGGTWLRPSGDFYNRDLNTASPTYSQFSYNLPRDLSASGHPLAGINTDPRTEHNLMCYIYTGCDAKAQTYFTNMTNPDPWMDRCECMMNNIPSTGVGTNFGVHRIVKDNNKMCNSDFVQGLSANRACDNTMTATGEYWLQSPDNLQGLTEQDAKFCACYNARGFNSTNNGGGSARSLDFRAGQPLQDPLVAPGAVPPILGSGLPDTHFGSRQSIAVNTTAVRITGGVTTTVNVGGPCDRINCDQIHHAGINQGCCTANRPVQWTVPVLEQRPQLATILNGAHGNFMDWVSYCSPECTGGETVQVSGRNVNEIQRVREIITGTAPGGAVPAACGQWVYGGMGGN